MWWIMPMVGAYPTHNVIMIVKATEFMLNMLAPGGCLLWAAGHWQGQTST
jgi:hypothetical protein